MLESASLQMQQSILDVNFKLQFLCYNVVVLWAFEKFEH